MTLACSKSNVKNSIQHPLYTNIYTTCFLYIYYHFSFFRAPCGRTLNCLRDGATQHTLETHGRHTASRSAHRSASHHQETRATSHVYHTAELPAQQDMSLSNSGTTLQQERAQISHDHCTGAIRTRHLNTTRLSTRWKQMVFTQSRSRSARHSYMVATNKQEGRNGITRTPYSTRKQKPESQGLNAAAGTNVDSYVSTKEQKALSVGVVSSSLALTCSDSV